MPQQRPSRGDHRGAVVPARQIPPAPPPPKKPEKTGTSLIEFSSEVREDPNDGLVFGDTPVHCACPHCERSVITFIDHEASWVTWVLGLVVWFSLGWMAFWILPLLWPAFKDVVHHCPRCLNVIARKSRISLPTFRSEIMTFKIGGCAVVLARKYVAILIGLVGVIATVYVLRSTVHLTAQEIEKGPTSHLAWEDFLRDCGPRTATSMRHRPPTTRAFEERYRRRSFTWQGEIRQIREGFDMLFLRTKSVVLVRMYPTRYHGHREHPDIALLFDDNLNTEVAVLNPNDWVQFEATMTAHGHRGDPEVMVLWHVKPLPRPLNLTDVWTPPERDPYSRFGGDRAHARSRAALHDENERSRSATGAKSSNSADGAAGATDTAGKQPAEAATASTPAGEVVHAKGPDAAANLAALEQAAATSAESGSAAKPASGGSDGAAAGGSDAATTGEQKEEIRT